jgi:hypothetical protein
MKSLLKLTVLSLIILSTFVSCITETTYIKPIDDKQTEILLIGTFHFDNPGLDIAKTNSFEVLNPKTQTELDVMAQKIKEFNPTKIFVEWSYDKQAKLDTLYNSYLNGSDDFSKDKNEIFQLAFRIGKLNNNERLEAIDYKMDFPFGEVMEIIENRNQTELKAEITAITQKVSTDFDEKIKQGISLTDMLLYHNTDEFRYMANNAYETILNAGDDSDFEGAQLVSQWNKRNLFMYSLIKKKTTKKDERVMVLLGASHIANIKRILDDNNDWKTVELKDVLTKKVF